jgi:hypothetical protein
MVSYKAKRKEANYRETLNCTLLKIGRVSTESYEKLEDTAMK